MRLAVRPRWYPLMSTQVVNSCAAAIELYVEIEIWSSQSKLKSSTVTQKPLRFASYIFIMKCIAGNFHWIWVLQASLV